MALTSDTDQESEQRWAAARALAQGIPDKRMRGRRRRLFALLFVILVAGWVVGGFLLPSPGSARGGTEGDAFTSRVMVGYALVVVGFVAGVVGFVWAKRTGRYITRWRQAISPLNRRERKWVVKQLRGKIPPNASKLDIVLAIAKQSRSATEGAIPLFTAPALMSAGLAIADDVDMLRWLHLLVAALLLTSAVLMAVDYRRWGIFIDTHGAAHGSSNTSMS